MYSTFLNMLDKSWKLLKKWLCVQEHTCRPGLNSPPLVCHFCLFLFLHSLSFFLLHSLGYLHCVRKFLHFSLHTLFCCLIWIIVFISFISAIKNLLEVYRQRPVIKDELTPPVCCSPGCMRN